MKGLTFAGEREVQMVEFPDPTPAAGEVVVEIRASGMCGSDLHAYRRPKGATAGPRSPFHDGPLIGGHEPCGVVAAVGPGVPPALARVGDRVMVHHYAGCGACNPCRSGWPQMCDCGAIHVYGNNDHGSHAPYLKVPAATLVALPEGLSFEAGAAISCGTGTAYGGLHRLGLGGHDTLAVFGQGPVGLAATQLAKAMGARVIALDVSDERLALAARFGADTTINPARVDPVEAIKAYTGGLGADVALDASGMAAARRSAVQCLKAWGRVCLVGEGAELHVDVSPDLLRKQITVMGSWTFSTILQSECARFVAERGVDVDALFTHRWRLDEGAQAYRLFDQQACGKGVFVL